MFFKESIVILLTNLIFLGFVPFLYFGKITECLLNRILGGEIFVEYLKYFYITSFILIFILSTIRPESSTGPLK